MTLNRALELRKLIGSAGCYPRPDIAPETAEEETEIMVRWKRLPGNTCYADALNYLISDYEADHQREEEANDIFLTNPEDISAAASMLTDLSKGIFYKKQEDSGFTIRYIGGAS